MHHGADAVDVLVLVVAVDLDKVTLSLALALALAGGLVGSEVLGRVVVDVLHVQGKVATDINGSVEIAKGEGFVVLIVRVHEEWIITILEIRQCKTREKSGMWENQRGITIIIWMEVWEDGQF